MLVQLTSVPYWKQSDTFDRIFSVCFVKFRTFTGVGYGKH